MVKLEKGILKYIDKELYNEIKELQNRLEKFYNKKISFKAASKIYANFKNYIK